MHCGLRAGKGAKPGGRGTSTAATNKQTTNDKTLTNNGVNPDMASAMHVRATDVLAIFLCATYLAGCTGFAPVRTTHHSCVATNARRFTELSIHPESMSSFLLSGEISNTLEHGTQVGRESIQAEQLDSTTTIIVFIIGIIPFLWATVEFWRRIAVGASFGTGSDSVVIPRPSDDLVTIGEDGNPLSSRGRQTLDRGALTVAYVLFAIAAGSVGIAIASVVMTPPMP